MRKIFLSTLMLVTALVAPLASVQAEGIASSEYTVELGKFGISNNGTNAVATTQGINDALVWASGEGYTKVALPEGTYLVDKEKSINLVSNITFELTPTTVIQKETSNKPHYETLLIGPGVENVTLKGGHYKGDKATHVYTGGGTHEGGYGIIVKGGKNITIDGVKATDFTGDGLSVGFTGSMIDEYYAADFKSGSVDASGNLIADGNKVRLENLRIDNPLLQKYRTFQLLHQKNVPAEAAAYTAYFYRADGSFISSVDTSSINKPVGWGLVDVPSDAASLNVVFDVSTVPSNIYLEYWVQGVSKDVVIKNSEFAFNRRQGITVGGAQNVTIENNQIHDMKGTAPQSGIDLEAGYNLNNEIYIRNNNFYNNQAYDLILYDGRNAVVEGNTFGSTSIGLAISEPFKYAEIKNNTFNKARIFAYNYATFTNNKIYDSQASFLGSNIVIDGFEVWDTLVNLAASTPFGIEASNINVYNTKKIHSQFGVNRNPINVTNVTISGPAALDSFAGNATDGSVFTNLKVLDFTRTQIVRGTYNNAEFVAAKGSTLYGYATAAVNNTGTYIFNDSSFTSDQGGFEVNSVHGLPDLVVLNNATITSTGANYSAVSIQAAKKVVVENSTISSGHTNGQLGAIQVSGYWDRVKANDIFDVTIKNNNITTLNKVHGISTIYAGVGAPAYTVAGNTLVNSVLTLKADDTVEGNTVK